MAGTTTATVETLTAEVRVMMVGSRQVTLSVAKQLDRVDCADLDPMGRVRIDKTLAGGYIEVIGTHRPSGTLAVAEVQTEATLPDFTTDAWCRWAVAALGRIRYAYRPEDCYDDEDRELFGMFKRRTRDGQHWFTRLTVTLTPRDGSTPIEAKVPNDPGHGGGLDSERFHALRAEWEAELVAEADRRRPLREWLAAAEVLPLIVLAGLK